MYSVFILVCIDLIIVGTNESADALLTATSIKVSTNETTWENLYITAREAAAAAVNKYGTKALLPKNVQKLDFSKMKYNYQTLVSGEGVYVAPGGKGMVAFAACAKCGSTSAFGAMYASMYGVPYPNNGKPPFVHAQHTWSRQGRPSGSLFLSVAALQEELAKQALSTNRTAITDKIPKMFFQVARDPVDRYFSSFHSKVMCCDPNTVPTGATVRKTCAWNPQETRSIVATIRENADSEMPPGDGEACLFFDEFATLMEMVHKKGNQHNPTLDRHVRAQRLDIPFGWIGWVGKIENLAVAVNRLRFGLHPVNITKMHASDREGWEPTEAGLKTMCKLAKREYKVLGLPYNEGPCVDHLEEEEVPVTREVAAIELQHTANLQFAWYVHSPNVLGGWSPLMSALRQCMKCTGAANRGPAGQFVNEMDQVGLLPSASIRWPKVGHHQQSEKKVHKLLQQLSTLKQSLQCDTIEPHSAGLKCTPKVISFQGFNKGDVGCCRFEGGSAGDKSTYTVLKDVQIAKECEAMCKAESSCKGFEHSIREGCELHTMQPLFATMEESIGVFSRTMVGCTCKKKVVTGKADDNVLCKRGVLHYNHVWSYNHVGKPLESLVRSAGYLPVVVGSTRNPFTYYLSHYFFALESQVGSPNGHSGLPKFGPEHDVCVPVAQRSSDACIAAFRTGLRQRMLTKGSQWAVMQHYYGSNLSIVPDWAWVPEENLGPSIERILERIMGRPLDLDALACLRNQLIRKPRKSGKGVISDLRAARPYYTEELIALVDRVDREIFKRFNYSSLSTG